MPIQLVHTEVTSVAGGSGGKPFEENAAGIQALVGFEVWSDKWVDAVEPIFADLSNLAVESSRNGGKYGGNAGAQQRFFIPGYVIVALVIRYDWYVDSIKIVAQRWANGAPDPQDEVSHLLGGPGGARSLQLALSPGYVATGIKGRADRWLDALGLVGAKFQQT
jgi:hypothetical protein